MILDSILKERIEHTKKFYKDRNKFIDLEKLDDYTNCLKTIYLSRDFTTTDRIFYLENCIKEYKEFVDVRELLYYSKFVAQYLSNLSSEDSFEFVARKVSYNIKVSEGIIDPNKEVVKNNKGIGE